MTNARRRGGLVLLALAAGLAVSACGRVGYLDQPAPLFGERAKEQYRAQRAADAETSRQRTASLRRPGEVERESTNPSSGDSAAPIGAAPASDSRPADPNAPVGTSGALQNRTAASQPSPSDNAPLTKRDLLDPAQRLTPLSASPLDGVPNDPSGAQPSLTPPN